MADKKQPVVGRIEQLSERSFGPPTFDHRSRVASSLPTPPPEVTSKLSNPKDVIGTTKVPMSLVPEIVIAYASLAWLEGKLKYGGVNWRHAGVRTSIYIDALKRHTAKYYDGGEWADEKTKVPHLASIIACAGIILDAALAGKLVDDRPLPQKDLSATLDNLSGQVAHLKELFKSYDPHHYTIQDVEPKKEE